MSPAPTVILQSLLSLDSIQLGRLVVNTRNPLEGFHDPHGQPPEGICKKHLKAFHKVFNLSKNSSLRSTMTALFSGSYQRQNDSALTVTAEHATTYQLENFGTWLQDACGKGDTRQWFEQMLQTYNRMYLVVAFHTLTNAEVVQQAVVKRTTTGGVKVSGVLMGVGPVDNLLSSRFNSETQTESRSESSMSASGEQVYAVEYRKIRFRWFSSRTIENSSLEKSNRWKVFMQDLRGEEETSDEEDEDDVLDVDLEDDEEQSDEELEDLEELGLGESCESEDGTVQFVF